MASQPKGCWFDSDPSFACGLHVTLSQVSCRIIVLLKQISLIIVISSNSKGSIDRNIKSRSPYKDLTLHSIPERGSFQGFVIFFLFPFDVTAGRREIKRHYD